MTAKRDQLRTLTVERLREHLKAIEREAREWIPDLKLDGVWAFPAEPDLFVMRWSLPCGRVDWTMPECTLLTNEEFRGERLLKRSVLQQEAQHAIRTLLTEQTRIRKLICDTKPSQ